MNRDNLIIHIISEDLVFIRIIEDMFRNYLKDPKIEKIFSFIELKEKHIVPPPVIVILDDFIMGAASLEIITFLRVNRRFTCPIYLFCESVPDFENKAIRIGANSCFTKPFKPMLVAEEIIRNLK